MAVEKLSGLGKKLLGALKRISGGAEYVLVAPEAIAGAAKTVYGKVGELDSKIDTSVDRAIDWTIDVVDKAGVGIKKGVESADKGLEVADNYVGEKYEAVGGWAKEKITEFKGRGRGAVEKFKDNRTKAEQRKQELNEAFRMAEVAMKESKNEVKAIMERDKTAKEAGERKEKNDKRWQELQAMYGMSKEIQKLGIGSQEIMDKAA